MHQASLQLKMQIFTFNFNLHRFKKSCTYSSDHAG